MLPFSLVYRDEYDFAFDQHVFPAVKYKLVRDSLLAAGFAGAADFAAPDSVSREDLLLVHTADWVDRFSKGALTFEETLRLEIPYTEAVVRGFGFATGGTILAARLALDRGAAFHIGGGFHHAFPAYGEGFCAYNDVAVAIRVLQRDGRIRRAAVVDCDVHQGNGTAAIFAGDDSVFTVSLHQLNNYPEEKPPSDLDIHLEDGTADEQYLEELSGAIQVLKAQAPDLIVYVAGADPYREDQLGGLKLSLDGLMERDRLAFRAARTMRVPIAVVLAGGYARDVEDTVRIHCNTARVLAEVMAER